MDTDIFGDDTPDDLGDEIARADTDEIVQRTRMIENEVKVLRTETSRLLHEHNGQKEKIKENAEKIKLNKQLPYLVSNVVELLDLQPEEDEEEDGAAADLDAQRTGKCCVLKTSTRQTIFLPIPGLVEPEKLKPADLVGVNKDSYLILESLPTDFDSRVKAMEARAPRAAAPPAAAEPPCRRAPRRWTRSPPRSSATWAGSTTRSRSSSRRSCCR
jgi:26S proteasome regulatory subunit T5